MSDRDLKPDNDPIALARQLLRALGQSDAQAANDDEAPIDEEAIRERARRKAEQMRKARHG